jgi:hypothetical protein
MPTSVLVETRNWLDTKARLKLFPDFSKHSLLETPLLKRKLEIAPFASTLQQWPVPLGELQHFTHVARPIGKLLEQALALQIVKNVQRVGKLAHDLLAFKLYAFDTG